MTVSKKLISKKSTISKIIFGTILLLTGLLLNFFKIGTKNFFSYNSVGSYLIIVGILIILISPILFYKRKNKIIDERQEKIGYIASRITFIIIILSYFTIMIIDGIKKITTPYSTFMGNLIIALTLTYIIIYKILEKKY